MEPLTNERLEQAVDAERATREGLTTRLTTQAEAAAMASEILNLRRRDEDLGLRWDPAARVIELFGTKFARPVLEQFRTSSGADDYYQHVRHEDGVVIVTRFVGLREQLRLLRGCLEARPEPDGLTAAQFEAAYLEWSAGAELLLKATVHEVAAEAAAVEALLEQARAFRETARALAIDDGEANRAAQVEAGCRLFALLDQVELARRRLTLWGLSLPAGYGTCAACGCTDGHACSKGCGWADETHTLCTRCAERVEHAAEGIE